MTERDSYKRAAALAAVDMVGSGSVVGLGTGSTASFAIEEIGARLTDGRLGDVLGIPTSEATATLATRCGIPLVDAGTDEVAIAIDGADEIAPDLSLVKGGGGAMLRERIVAALAATFVIVADDAKLVPALGTGCAVPVEVARFGAGATLAHLRSLGHPTLRLDGDELFVTDNGNLVVDLAVDPINDPGWLDASLRAVPGVLATGLFVAMADVAIVGGPGGITTMLGRTAPAPG
ncbi:MAG: ribose-5-phosphate isomerase RpiA [Acidimicrobiia bacterium]|nr:ribose-5-phosphate isomerase RpiA [Acidimicrobiia bacterium]